MKRCSLLSFFALPLLIQAGEPIKPALEVQPAVVEKLKSLKQNQTVLLGQPMRALAMPAWS